MQSKATSVLIITAAYVLAVIIAVRFGRIFSFENELVMIGIADLAATVFIFGLSMLFNNSSMYDPYWSIKPVVIAGYFAIRTGLENMSLPQYLILAAVVIYAARLTLNFYRGWEGLRHEDWRYRNFREQYGSLYWVISFFGIHLFPTIMVYLGCLPMFGIFAWGQGWHGLLGLLGVVIMIGAVVLAFIADEQLRVFRNNSSNKGKLMNSGLWKTSRHPNYFGEILFWWGLYLVAVSFDVKYWWTGAGALVITLMFRFISIPLMEKHIRDRSGFQDYFSTVPALIPGFRLKTKN